MTKSKSQALTPAQEALLHEHLPIVNYMVNDLIRRVPNYIQRDDLTSAAMLGLVQAVRSFDTTREAKFATFARVRIQGALLDELRSRDWATRGVRKQARHIESVSETLSSTLGRQPTSAELGETMGTNADQLHRLKADLHRATVLEPRRSDRGNEPHTTRCTWRFTMKILIRPINSFNVNFSHMYVMRWPIFPSVCATLSSGISLKNDQWWSWRRNSA